MKNLEPKIKKLTVDILKDYSQGRTIDKMNTFTSPDMDIVVDILDKLQKILFPGYYRNKNYHFYTAENNLQTLIEDVLFNLTKQISMYLRYLPEFSNADYRTGMDRAQEIALEFLSRIPRIRDLVETSVQAEFDGDPAAFNKDEIIFCYPGMYAIMVFRLAHEFYDLGVPMLPRIMSEYAHSKTGIDIHPGATIGRYFFIDHGTGIVVGETTVIGDNVKIIGHDSVIGGNTFITMSVPPGSNVSIKSQELHISSKGRPDTEAKDLDQSATWFYTI